LNASDVGQLRLWSNYRPHWRLALIKWARTICYRLMSAAPPP
jgi:hypothetical protein